MIEGNFQLHIISGYGVENSPRWSATYSQITTNDNEPNRVFSIAFFPSFQALVEYFSYNSTYPVCDVRISEDDLRLATDEYLGTIGFFSKIPNLIVSE